MMVSRVSFLYKKKCNNNKTRIKCEMFDHVLVPSVLLVYKKKTT